MFLCLSKPQATPTIFSYESSTSKPSPLHSNSKALNEFEPKSIDTILTPFLLKYQKLTLKGII